MYPIDERWSARMQAEVANGHMGAKLAFTRLSFNYYISEPAFAYVVDAVHLLADARAGSCCRSTASIPRPGSGITAPPARARRPVSATR